MGSESEAGPSAAAPTADGMPDAPPASGAARVLSTAQKLSLALVGLWLLFFFTLHYKVAFSVLLFAACVFYLAVIGYKLLIVMLSLVRRPEIRVTPEEIAAARASELPVYTVLVPLYRETEVAAKVVRAVGALDYPQELLDVKLLLEADDPETIEACRAADLPGFVEIVIVPDGRPKTKPRACNHGLAGARGEFLVIYDAEDRPEPDQLLKAVAAFRRSDEETACLQAKLNYYNPDQSHLTRFFTLEYTTWFDLFLPGLHALGVPIPLGGTSNHFCTDVLRELGGWDPFNVAEDCDLGIRIHRAGYRTRVVDSTTWEEATAELGNWLRQRSRWVKGYLQTHLVHTRPGRSRADALLRWVGAAAFIAFVAVFSLTITRLMHTAEGETWPHEAYALFEYAHWGVALFALAWLVRGLVRGTRRLGAMGHASFLATVWGLSATLLLNPVYWIAMLVYLVRPWKIWYAEGISEYHQGLNLYRLLWDAITGRGALADIGFMDGWSIVSQLFVPIAVVLLLANAVFILTALAACLRRRLARLWLYALAMPIYWIFISVAAWKGALQLITRPFYWEKTRHGLFDAGTEPAPPNGESSEAPA